MRHSKARAGLPRLEIPHAYITIAATTDQGVVPWDHSPDAHNMPLQCALRITLGIENVYLGIIKGDNDVLGRQVQTGNNPTLLCDVPCRAGAARSPSGLHQVSLLEVRLVGT